MLQRKRVLAFLICFLMSFSTFQAVANQDEEKYIFEDYETGFSVGTVTETEFFNQSTVWSVLSVAGGAGLKIDSERNGNAANQYLTLDCSDASSGATLVSKLDLFTLDRTIVKFRIKSSTAENGRISAAVILRDNTNNKDQILLQFGYTGLNLFGKPEYPVPYIADRWYDISMVVDRANQQVTVRCGSVSATASIDIIDTSCLRIKSIGPNKVSVDDIQVSDDFYFEGQYLIDEDFELLSVGPASVADISTGLSTNLKDQVSVDRSSSGNLYLTLQGGATPDTATPLLYTTKTLPAKKVVLDFDIKLSELTYVFETYIRINSSLSVSLLHFAGGNLKILGQQVNNISLSGDDFVNCRFVITPGGEYIAFLNGQWIVTKPFTQNVVGADIRFQCNRDATLPADPTVTTAYLDNIKLYTPAPAQLRSVQPVDGSSGVENLAYISIISNNDPNPSSMTPSNFLLDGSSENIDRILFDSAASVFRIYPVGGFLQNHTYTLETLPNAAKDHYDQYYDFHMSFTTGSCDITTQFYHNDEPVSSMEAGTIEARVQFNVSGNPWKGTVIMALYENGVLTDCRISKESSFAHGTMISQKFETTENSRLQVFVWNELNGGTPLVPKAVLDRS